MIENAKIQFFYYKKSYFCSMNNKRIFEMRRFIKRLMFALVLLCGSQSVFSQVDTAFWFAVPKLAHTHVHWPIVLVVSNTESQQATVTVTKAASGQQVGTPFTVPANGSATMTLVSNEAGLNGYECEYNTISPHGLYIQSNRKINAYVALQNNNSEIYALKGGNALGTQFFVPMQFQYTTGNGNQSDGTYGTCRNAVEIIATEDNTTVTITPSQTCGTGSNQHQAGSTFSITLQRGQVYCLASNSQAATGHLDGTIITSNKPIVVDVSDDSVNPGNGSGNYDLVADQIVPEDLAGSEYVVFPSPNAAGNSTTGGGMSDYAFIFVLDDNTDVTIYYETNSGNQESTQYQNLMRGDKRSFHFTNYKPAYIRAYHENPDGTRSPRKLFVFQLTGAGNELGGTQLPQINCTGSQTVTYRPLQHPNNDPKHIFLNLVCTQLSVYGSNQITEGFQIQTNSGNIQIMASDWHTVPGSPSMYYCQKDISNYATRQYIKVSNSVGKFHMGVIDYHQPSGYDDCSISYFSSYVSGSEIHWSSPSDYCQGDTMFFDFDSINASILRVLGPNNFEINSPPFQLDNAMPSDSGWYTVIANDSRGCPLDPLMSDSIKIMVHPIVDTVLYDTICPGVAYTQNGFDIPIDSTVVPHTIVDTVVTQTVEFGCDSLLILHLKVRDSVFGEFSKKACNQYTWNGQTYRTSGDYDQTLTDVNGCDSLVTLHLEIEEPSVEIVPSGDDFCEFGELVLTAVSDYDDYLWSTGDTTQFISVTTPQTLYTVTVTQGDCMATSHYETPDCPLNIFLPSGISPSRSDGLNDYFYLPEYVHRFISYFDMEIYDRWGELVFKTNDMNFRWYGNIDDKGSGMRVHVSDVYVYIIHYERLGEKKRYVKKGTVTVL